MRSEGSLTPDHCRCAYCAFCATGYLVCVCEDSKHFNHVVGINWYRRCPHFDFTEEHVDTGRPYSGDRGPRCKRPDNYKIIFSGGDDDDRA